MIEYSPSKYDLRRLWRRVGVVATLEGPFARQRFCAPQVMKQHWNKGPAIWFPSRAGLAAKHTTAAQRPA
jgi:hypothetical protein